MPEIKQKEELLRLREEISALDSALLANWEERMALIQKVAAHKKEHGGQVLAPAREEELIRQAEKAVTPHLSSYAAQLQNTLLRLSRELQYDLLLDGDLSWPLGKLLRQAASAAKSTEADGTEAGSQGNSMNTGSAPPTVRTVAFPGTLESYSAQAAALFYPEATLIPVGTFPAACRQLLDGNVDRAVLPLENSTAGTVEASYNLLEKHGLYIEKSLGLPIRHALLGLPASELADVRRVASHPQALKQCSYLIDAMGWSVEEAKNTAFAARALIEKGDKTLGALAAPEAAEALGLKILLPEASNTEENETRFVALSRTLTLDENAERVSILLKAPNTPGSLAHILQVFADLGLNLAKIESRPIPKRPWDYSFYLDFMAPLGSRAAVRALYQLDLETPNLRLLGWYPEQTILKNTKINS